MSNFYWCRDCKVAVDLVVAYKADGQKIDQGFFGEVKQCGKCFGTNWETVIDEPSVGKANRRKK